MESKMQTALDQKFTFLKGVYDFSAVKTKTLSENLAIIETNDNLVGITIYVQSH